MDGLEDDQFPFLGPLATFEWWILLLNFWKVILKSEKKNTLDVLAYFAYKTRVSVKATVVTI